MKCAFCDELKWNIRGTIGTETKAVEFRAALERYVYPRDNGIFEGTKVTRGRYQLNFCPECGKKISHRNIKNIVWEEEQR